MRDLYLYTIITSPLHAILTTENLTFDRWRQHLPETNYRHIQCPNGRCSLSPLVLQ